LRRRPKSAASDDVASLSDAIGPRQRLALDDKCTTDEVPGMTRIVEEALGPVEHTELVMKSACRIDEP
jgi:hypothetical protein